MTKRVISLTGGERPIFAWRLPQEIASYKQPRLPATQWAHVIKGMASKGIKLIEIEDSGVLDWLEERGKEQVTREDVAEFVSFSLPNIKEVQLSGKDAGYRGYSWAIGAGDDYNESLFYFPQTVEDYADRIADLDEAISQLNFDFERLGQDPDLVFRLDFKRQELVDRKDTTLSARAISGAPPTHFANRLTEICPDARADFAHMRWSVFDLDGQRTLFIHEFQSDWAQKGRAEAERIQEREMFAAVEKERARMEPNEAEAFASLPRSRRTAEQSAVIDGLYTKYVGPLPGAPEWKGAYKKAPLVAETEHWAGFLVRRAMALAVENNCQQLTWINGAKMSNGGVVKGAPGLDEFYMRIIPSIGKKFAKPYSAELKLGKFTRFGDNQLAVMPVTPAMKEFFLPKVPVYSYANVVASATFDQAEAEKLRRALQLRANRMFGREDSLRVCVVREILHACKEERPAGKLIGRAAEIAFGAQDPVAALDHEAFHFAYRYHFTSRERSVIAQQFQPGSPLLVRTMHLLMSEGNMQAANQAAHDPEEASAHAFALWRKGEMSLTRLESSLASPESRGLVAWVLDKVFPRAEMFVTSVCSWIRGTSVSPTDFAARIVRIHEESLRALRETSSAVRDFRVSHAQANTLEDMAQLTPDHPT